ncbi:MAG: MFS transporter [Pseudomonadota bacterium]
MSARERPHQRMARLLSHRVFALTWLGQTVATLCMSISEFSVTIWLYQHNKSVLQYASAIVFAVVPALLVGPWAGSLVDRSDRRKLMLGANVGAALCAATLAGFVYLDRLAPWHVYVAIGLTSVFQAFHRIAYQTTASTLVEPGLLGSANGMLQLAFSISQLAAPVIAGVLLAYIKLPGVLMLEALGLVFAACTLLVLRFPPAPPDGARTQDASAWSDCVEALRFLRHRPGLIVLTVYGALENFFLGMAMILTMPMLLANHSEAAAGLVMSFCGGGMIAGSLLMIGWGGPRRLVAGLLGVDFLFGGMIGALGAGTALPFLCAGIFVAAACGPIVSSCTQTVIQRSAPLAMRGRILALTGMLSMCSVPAAALIGGLLADRIFEPSMLPGGALAGSAGALIGLGKGRGIGLMFVLAGAIVAVMAALALRMPVLRAIDDALAHDDESDRPPVQGAASAATP